MSLVRVAAFAVVSVALLGYEDNLASECLKALESDEFAEKSNLDIGASGVKIKAQCTESLGVDANTTQIEQCVCNEIAQEGDEYQHGLITQGVCSTLSDNEAVAEKLAAAEAAFSGQTQRACTDKSLIPEIIRPPMVM